jgi:hypothetical protein
LTRAAIRALISANLGDVGISYYQESEINSSIQDGYNEVVAKSLCLVKSVTMDWLDGVNYYDFLALGVNDYIGTIAIFNNVTNVFLKDDISIRDFDRIRRDWELWEGTPLFWAPHSLYKIAVAPRPTTATGTFTLYYWAKADTLSDSSVPIIATDVQEILEFYSTADLLETAEEITKAQNYWKDYQGGLLDYKNRCHLLASSDLVLRV